ncbi:NAD(P)H-dependent oxidoreductase [Halobacillus litoralis]|uniref:NAD(P)H-dependent oxidoreductase n=1 Tax=Halobacillus litoralis TaxID=45668 RepID=UPI001CD50605|nr:NAD(P)H-dependent oxidoreductase [Halobacillus litoralis]MCA1023798.1 NAD(P)H-dependent oxidoreductase [Halobacillus litoralis]
MENILIINGHEYWSFSPGRLNKTLFDEIINSLEGSYNIKTTVVQDGYNVKEEQEKFKWADTIIFQTPINWFSLPGAFKTYIDAVYEPGVFFGGGGEYGHGGLIEGKYMFSTTWNAPEYAFNDTEKFFKGQDIEGALDHLHNMNKYVGLEPLKSFGAHDVMKNPDIEKYVSELRQHLKEVFNV